MSGGWQGSNRRAELPPNWDTDIRPRILARDGYRCTWRTNYKRCRATATDVDHIKRGNDHSDANLRSLCDWHHKRKSSAEGNAARQRWSIKRPAEKHPGLID